MKTAHCLMRIPQRRRISRAVGKEHAFGSEGENFIGGSRRGHDLDSKSVSPKRAEDVALQSKVIGDDSMGNRRKLLEEIAGCVNGGFGRNLTSREHPLSTFSILDIPVVG